MWPITLSGRLTIVGLVGRYLTNYLIVRELTLNRISPLTPLPCDIVVSCGISRCFHLLSPCLGQIAHALLTRPPLKHPKVSPLDLHVLGTPPAFVLSQDQTLMFNPSHPALISLGSLRCLSQKSDCLLLALAWTLSSPRGLRKLCSCLSVFHYIVFKDRLPP